jgi:glutaredoxin
MIVISKKNCGPCIALKSFLSTLPEECHSKVEFRDESNHTMDQLYKELEKVNTWGFPTIIMGDKVSTGFGPATIQTIKKYLEC